MIFVPYIQGIRTALWGSVTMRNVFGLFTRMSLIMSGGVSRGMFGVAELGPASKATAASLLIP